ncbi:MAG TPA: response regulator transcription factor [Nitrospira sp.]|nr:response regulator transcription factor [Nitrospira sp.]
MFFNGNPVEIDQIVRTGGIVETGPRKNEPKIVPVLLVDDHAMLRRELRTVLDSYDDLLVVGEGRDGVEAVRLVDELGPHVVVMDINMPRMGGVEATAHIKFHQPYIAVVGISIDASDENSAAMKKAGATTVVPKAAAIEKLHDAIVEAITKRPPP